MFAKKLLILFFIVLSSLQPLFASKCLMSQALENPRLQNNQDFWSEYSTLMASSRNTDQVLEQLIRKYDPPTAVAPTGAGASAQTSVQLNRSLELDVHRRARKEMSKLQPRLRQKVDDFLEVALRPGGIKELYDNPGRWHFEKLPQFGPDAHSVRLNDGFRALFDVKDGKLLLREVNKGHIHGD